MKVSVIVACSFVLIGNNVFSQYITWDSNDEKDLSACPYQLAIAQKELQRVDKKIKDLSGKSIYIILSCISISSTVGLLYQTLKNKTRKHLNMDAFKTIRK